MYIMHKYRLNFLSLFRGQLTTSKEFCCFQPLLYREYRMLVFPPQLPPPLVYRDHRIIVFTLLLSASLVQRTCNAYVPAAVSSTLCKEKIQCLCLHCGVQPPLYSWDACWEQSWTRKPCSICRRSSFL